MNAQTAMSLDNLEAHTKMFETVEDLFYYLKQRIKADPNVLKQQIFLSKDPEGSDIKKLMGLSDAYLADGKFVFDDIEDPIEIEDLEKNNVNVEECFVLFPE